MGGELPLQYRVRLTTAVPKYQSEAPGMRLAISTRTALKKQQRVPSEGRAVHSWEQWRESGYSLRQSYSVLHRPFMTHHPGTSWNPHTHPLPGRWNGCA